MAHTWDGALGECTVGAMKVDKNTLVGPGLHNSC